MVTKEYKTTALKRLSVVSPSAFRMSLNGNMIKTENRVTTNGYSANNSSTNNMGDEDPFNQQICCLVENGRQCTRIAGNACYSKKIQKTVAQRKLKLHMNDNVSCTDKTFIDRRAPE